MGRRTYRGHRRESFVATDVNELVELRARQRTFHGAYSRTALGNLGYALTVLRLFDRRFYKIGLIFLILSALLFLIAYLRSRHSNHDFADQAEMLTPELVEEEQPEERTQDTRSDEGQSSTATRTLSPDASEESDSSASPTRRRQEVIQTKGQENTRVFGRPFVTAGWIVIAVTGVVAATEIGILILIFKV
ncbi:hypothetical protein CYLTODRAFT_490460 [Cylindrobasidium torrendii FP15055 ss-10]|uniref:DUF202 domain-containing protein n=1 Tax=Cylindrobasidium torrendii FP15055 ss-10 TaxID=1314674 RepID=A0A0D7BBR7_9AGAR|nr:hypothetical protein CYLTODRAFT_490460 [Cylindrobasidium torrendii FP15055 ss-10]